MSWTYDNTQFASTSAGIYPKSTVGARYQVRFWLQDTQSTRPLVQDQEIDWALNQYANVYMAAAALCDSLVAQAGNTKSRKVGELAIDYDPQFYRGLAAVLRSRGLTYQGPSVGGISVVDKIAAAADSDAVTPAFFRGEGQNPSAPQPAPGAVNPPLTTGPGG